MKKPFQALIVRRANDNTISCNIETLSLNDLPPGEVVVEVECSSLNYKDALALQGHPGVVKNFPHVPGIDCAGRVVESASPAFAAGDEVLVTGYGLGSEVWGGYSNYVRLPATWVVALPERLTIDQAMTYGTAGFTAAQCVASIRHHAITPEDGEVVVTGASGGVGSISVAILSKLGYRVTAVTGKSDQAQTLGQLGAAQVVGREEVDDRSDRPLLKARWAAAIDTVGENILATLLRQTAHRGCVAACGMAAGHALRTTVYPFILRGVTLAGIDSAQCPRTPRLDVWRHLAGDWNVVDRLQAIVREVALSEVPAQAAAMLEGKTRGRILVRLRR